MARIGSADLLIVPKFDGLSSSVNKALGNVDMSSSGKLGGSTYANGFKSSLSSLGTGAIMGAVSAATTKAIDAIASHMSDAVSRLDTLKNYPQVMQALGVSAKEADASINTMSDRLLSLPTRLDSMTSSVQGIYAATKDYGVSLQTATEAGLAMNDLLLSGGQGLEVTNAAMEQFRQMLAKGKPEMQDWKALLSAAPGQMDQLAKSMLGPTANANDLYEALGGGKNDPTITMSELLDALIKLDKEGGAGLESLQAQAEKATGGIETSMANMENAITRGLADTMDAIGRDRISGFFNTAKGAINDFFGVVKSVAPSVIDAFSGIVSTVVNVGPALVAAAAGAAAFAKIGPLLTASGITRLVDILPGMALGAESVAAKFSGMLAAINPVAVGIGVAVAAVGVAAVKFSELKAAQERASIATTSFNDAVARSTGLDDYAGRIDGIGVAASTTALSMSDFYANMQKHTDAMQKNNDAAEQEIATLNTIQGVIGEYAGKAEEGVTVANMSAEAHGQLEYALKQLSDQYGINITAEQVLSGSYEDEEGNIVDVKDAVNELCEARKNEARTAALSANLTEAYSAQREALQQVYDTQDALTKKRGEYIDFYNNSASDEIRQTYATAEAYADWATEMDGTAASAEEAEKAYKNATNAVSALESEFGDANGTIADVKESLMGMADEAGNTLVSELAKCGVNVDELSTKLASAGVSTETLESVGSASLATLARNCNGDVASMVYALQNLDGIDIHDKSFDVNDDGTIVFEKGQLSDLDKQKLRDKGFIVTDNDTSTVARLSVDKLSDSIWSIPRNTRANVDARVSGESDVWDLYNALKAAAGNWYVNVATSFFGSAGATGAGVMGADILAGAIPAKGLYERMKAAGGISPLLHADGGIVDSPTLTSVGFVGEAGAEAIVPLTNRQYVRPFAHAIAEEMGSMGADRIIGWLAANLGPIIGTSAPTATPRELRRINQKVAAYA